MSSSSLSPRRSPQVQQKQKPHKIFVTNLDIEVEPQALETQLFDKFSKFGKLDSVVVKKSYNNKYSFAFIEFREGQDATSAVQELNGLLLNSRKIKVELQDNTRRRRGGDETKVTRTQTCFVCGKVGHFAKNCRQNKEKAEVERKSRSRSRSSRQRQQKRKKKSKKRRHRSSSSESRSPKRKDKKQRSRKIKKSSRHKRKRSGSNSA